MHVCGARTSVFSRENIEERSPARTVAMTPSMLSSRIVSYTRDIRPCMCGDTCREMYVCVKKGRERERNLGERKVERERERERERGYLS